MTIAYVTNWNLQDTLDIEQEDPSTRNMGLHDFATPRLEGVSLSEPDLSELKGRMTEEVQEIFDNEALDVRWDEGDWVKSQWEGGRTARHINMVDVETDEVLGAIVIQQVEMD